MGNWASIHQNRWRDDKVSSGAGDDVVVVQGQGDVEVDTGVGDDRVVVDSSFFWNSFH